LDGLDVNIRLDEIAEFLHPGTIIAERFRVLQPIGAGAVAAVYLVEDLLLSQLVALKAMHVDILPDEVSTARFLREVAVTRTISHPNVVRTYDLGKHRQALYYTMEYVNGSTLQTLMRCGHHLTNDYIEHILIQILHGLDAIHSAEVIHRDLKPSNILVSKEDKVLIADFGLARIERSDLTGEHVMLGTAAYMAPEQLTAQAVGPATDLYSLGVILFEVYCGRTPFAADNVQAIVQGHLHERPPAVRDMCTGVPLFLEALIRNLLEKRAEDRPQSAKAVLEWLARHLNAREEEQ